MNSTSSTPLNDAATNMKADSGATSHYIRPQDLHFLTDIVHCNGPKVYQPDKTTLSITKQGTLQLSPSLSQNAKQANILPGLANASLLSIGKLCNDDCTAIFTKHNFYVVKNNSVLLEGTRNWSDGLWDIPLPNHRPKKQAEDASINSNSINYIVQKDQPKYKLAAYLHACLFSPSLSTLQKSITNKNLLTFPNIDRINFKQALGPTKSEAKGHLDQEASGLQSTKQTDDAFPTKEEPSYQAMLSMVESANLNQKSYLDLTGKFPHTSSRGYKYVLIVYDHDSNAILAQALKTRQASEIKTAWHLLFNIINRNGHTTNFWIMDNEASTHLKNAMIANKQQYQLTPPHMHRINAAERAIRTFKNHFLAGLATCDAEYPVNEWDRLIPSSNITLNLLRNSRINPYLSSYAFLFGQFDFNRTPLCPPGTKCIIHAKPNQRSSWQFHGKEAWTIGPSLNHYRCIRCFIPTTRTEVDVDTLVLLPTRYFLPKTTLDDHIRHVAAKLLRLLSNNKHPLPGLKILPSTYTALINLQNIFKYNLTQSPPSLQVQPNKQPRMMIHSQKIQSYTPNELIHKHVVRKTEGEPSTIFNQPTMPYLQKTEGGTFAPTSNPFMMNNNPTSIQSSMYPSLHPRNTFKNKPLNPIVSKPPIYHKMIPADKMSSPIHQYTPILHDSNHHQKIIPSGIVKNHLQHKLFHIYYHGTKLSLEQLLLGPDKIIWTNALTNEMGRTSQGINKLLGNDTLEFIKKGEVPSGRKVTYANFVCDYRPFKLEKYRVRMTVGGDRLEYPYDTTSPAASLLETKVLINSVISDASKGAKFCTVDIKDFFLQTIMEIPEYMRIHSKYFTDPIRKKYNIDSKIAEDNYVYCKIKRGMYGLKQAARLAYDLLKTRLAPFGYYPDMVCPNVWKHKSRPTTFILCVDDFGIKYFTKEDALHLMNALKTNYEITIDWTGEHYCGLLLKWNYPAGYVDVSMPKYVSKFLTKQKHSAPTIPQHAPHKWSEPVYGRKVQYAKNVDTSPKLNKTDTKNIQSIAGSMLYYGRGVDYTIIPSVNELSISQSQPTTFTQQKAKMLLDYLHTHPSATLRFHASKMILHIDSDAAYLVAPNAKSRIAGYFYLGDGTETTKLNAGIHVECCLLKHVVASAAEAETGGVFHNCQFGVHIRRMLTVLNHPQPPTLVKTDNSTAESFVNKHIKQKRSKSWDMRFHWLRDQETQNNFKIYWDKSKNNYADYFTKHHAPSHHQKMRPIYLQVNKVAEMINILTQISTQ